MVRPPFVTKHFELQQSRAAMPVGTDGMLLGAYAAQQACQHLHRVLDIGTGTGVIPLMLLQRAPHLKIDAIEIDEGSVCDAHHNFQNSPWKEHLHLISGDILQYTTSESYDLIISNPPYYLDHHWSDTPSKTQAKHANTLIPSRFFRKASTLLADTAEASILLILSTHSLSHFLEAAEVEKLFPSLLLYVSTRRGKAPTRVITRLQRQAISLPTEEYLDILVGSGRHDYSEAYRQLLKPYLIIL